jgi:hypothetical protein
VQKAQGGDSHGGYSGKNSRSNDGDRCGGSGLQICGDIACDRGIDFLNYTNRFETLDCVLPTMLAVLVGLLAV